MKKKSLKSHFKTSWFKTASVALGVALLLAVPAASTLNAKADGETVNLDELDTNYGYVSVPDQEYAESVYEESDALFADTIPASYDSRSYNRVTSVKNQNPYGACWSFATMAAVESSMISKGLYNKNNIDLSEMHLVRYSYQSNAGDPLGGTNSDQFSYPYTDAAKLCDAGGNPLVQYHVLANWKGAVPDSYNTYPNNPNKNTIDDAYGHNMVHVQQFYRINTADRNSVKKAIMDYGAVTGSLGYYDLFMNNSTGAYYCNAPIGQNHAITIVGWNDNYSKSNFASGRAYYLDGELTYSTQPTVNGAWLVKNSWGTSWGNSGYFWMSYQDLSIGSAMCAFEADKVGTYDHNYQYDGTWFNTTAYGTTFANEFVIKSCRQDVKAVSFDTPSANCSYTVKIYKNLTNPANPESGTLVSEATTSGTTKFSGLYTVKLKNKVAMEANTRFAVVITITKGSSNGNMYAECSQSYATANGYLRHTATAAANQSFVKNGSSWTDYGASYNRNLRIKAYTSDNVVPTGIGLTYDSLTLEKGKTQQIGVKVIPDNAKDKSVTWTSSNTAVATVDAKGNVKAIKTGSCSITAKTVNGLSKSCAVKVIVKPTAIKLNKTSATMYFGNSLTLTPIFTPSDTTEKTLTWTISDKNVGSVNNGVVKVWAAGKVTVTAKTVNGLTATCTITVLADNASGNPFADIKKDSWQYTPAKYVYDKKYMTGTGTLASRVIFSPNTKINRSQLITALYSVDGKPSTTYKRYFNDVPSGEWYSIPITWAAKNGIVSGYTDGSFQVNKAASREQLAVILYNYAKYKKYNVSASASLAGFSDASDISSFAVPAIKWAVAKGIIAGKDGRIDPAGKATRAEFAAMLKKFRESYNLKEGFDEEFDLEEPIDLPEEILLPEEDEIIDDEDEIIDDEDEEDEDIVPGEDEDKKDEDVNPDDQDDKKDDKKDEQIDDSEPGEEPNVPDKPVPDEEEEEENPESEEPKPADDVLPEE